MEVRQSVRLPASVTEVWKRIGGFNALPDWHPMVEKSELAEGGAVRKLTIPGAGVLVERLEGEDDSARTYTYAIKDGPLPVSDYHATLRPGRGRRVRRRVVLPVTSTMDWARTRSPAGVMIMKLRAS